MIDFGSGGFVYSYLLEYDHFANIVWTDYTDMFFRGRYDL
jgi:hypothetical protein